MAEIFYDKNLSQQLIQNGFVRTPVLNTQEILELKELYISLGPPDRKGTHVTMFAPSYEYRCAVDKGIKKICAEKVVGLMKGYRALYANFMVKESGQEGDFPLHQDWTYVDEHIQNSIAVWIPLHDVDENNGALHMVKGSHKFITQLRGPYVHEPFGHIANEIKRDYSLCADLAAGEALIWDHRLIHFSKPNMTSSPRLAVTIILVPEDARVIHCYAQPESNGKRIEKYIVDTDFYMQYVISRKPEGVPLIEIVDQSARDFTIEEFKQMFRDANQV